MRLKGNPRFHSLERPLDQNLRGSSHGPGTLHAVPQNIKDDEIPVTYFWNNSQFEDVDS